MPVRKHGFAGSPTYKVWSQIKDKCLNPRSKAYIRHGGREIVMHPDWATNFQAFHDAVGPRPSPNHRLERYPNRKGGYVPGNLRWKEGLVTCLPKDGAPAPPSIQKVLGQKFGKLFTKDFQVVVLANGSRHCKVVCVCDCGGTATVFKQALHAKSSCGCDKSHYLKNSGKQNYRFKGFEEIRASFWSGYRTGAEARGIPFDLTMEAAWRLFQRQKGCCALTGVSLTFGAGKNSNTTASVDRLDASKGYTEDNVQWVHKTINLMRNVLSVPDFLHWCSLVSSHQSSCKAA